VIGGTRAGWLAALAAGPIAKETLVAAPGQWVSATSADTARGGLRVVEQMFYKIQRLLLQQEQKSKQQHHWQQWSRPEMQRKYSRVYCRA
jgi:hypothetical protein